LQSERQRSTAFAKIRLSAIALLFLFSLLILFPAPTYTLWMLEIVAAEQGHYAALLALALLPLRRDWVGLSSVVLAVATFVIAVSPLVRAFRVASTLPRRLDSAFGVPIPPLLASPPALGEPITLRSLLPAPRSTSVIVTPLRYASRPMGPLDLDLYRNPVSAVPRPVIVVVHGGSWQGGSRSDLAGLNYRLAAEGYAVASVSYRFAPEFPNPAATEDLNAALDYLKSNSTRLGLDPSRVVLLGRSSGGHLALLSAYTKKDSSLRGVVGLYPPIDQLYGYRNPSRVIPSRRILEDFLSGTPTSNPLAYTGTSPIRFVDARTVPTLLIHGSKDELVSVKQSRMLDARLDAAGRPHLLLELPWATHGCDYFLSGPCGQIASYAIERFVAAVTR